MQKDSNVLRVQQLSDIRKANAMKESLSKYKNKESINETDVMSKKNEMVFEKGILKTQKKL